MGDFEPRERNQQKSTAQAGPSASDRYGSGVVGKNVESRILGYTVDGDRTRVTMSQGTAKGVRVGMEGYVCGAGGMLSELQIDAVEPWRCHAYLDVTPDELGTHFLVVINPTSKPRAGITKDVHTRVIGMSADSGRTQIIIDRGAANGVTVGMQGHLVSTDRRAGDAFTIAGTTTRQSMAYVANTVDYVNQHKQVVLHSSLPRPPAPVQRRASGPSSAADVQSTAQAGVAGATSRLPHFDTIQRAFGKHDLSGVRAQIGGAATEAAGALGAQAYATGNQVAFASAPDLHTAAHEAAHTVQQSRGAVGFQGLGAADDEHERNADAVADAVVAGRSAEHLLDAVAEKHTGATSDGVVQRKPAGDLVAVPTPDKESSSNGEEWEQQGACVRDNPGVQGCYLSNAGRAALLFQVSSRANTARTNYKMAASDLKTDVRLKKESDFGFIPTIYKEFVTNTLIGALTKGILKLRGSKEGVEVFTDDAIKAITKSLGGYGTKQGESVLKKELDHGATNEKNGKLAYLNQVQNDVDEYFDALLLSCQRDATDARLQVLYEGFAPALNTIEVLKEALSAKLDRFVRSGVLQIGRGMAPKPTEGGDTKYVHDDRRVVWIWVGKDKELFYEHHESKFGTSADAAYGSTSSRNDGERHFGKPVPREFWTQALAASEAKWGTTPYMTLSPDKVKELTGRAR